MVSGPISDAATARQTLLDLLGDRPLGLAVSREQAAAIEAAVAALEPHNPTAAPTAAADLLRADWRLRYTTNLELLGIDRAPLIGLDRVYQTVRPETGQVVNIAEVRTLPGLESLVSVRARATAVSSTRFRVEFERFVAGPQRLLGYRGPEDWVARVERPERFWGVDLAIAPGSRCGWIEITYLDARLRINRGNEGSLFVLTRSGDDA